MRDQDPFLLNGHRQLVALRKQTGLQSILLDSAPFKHRGLFPLAVRVSYFALRKGGRLTVRDTGPRNVVALPFSISFETLTQWAMRVSGEDFVLRSVHGSELVLERLSDPCPPGWAAGVIFSGSLAEVATVERCLDGLERQAELGYPGSIAICGPTGGQRLFCSRPSLRYLEYDERDVDGRFLVGRKKNFLISELRANRIAVLHARVILDANALSRVPNEFDIMAPNVEVMEFGVRRPYLSLCYSDSANLGVMPTRAARSMRNTWPSDHLELYRHGSPYVDGGGFFIMKRVHEKLPLSDTIAWGEGEDVEWCARGAALGFVAELAVDAGALSQTHKLRARRFSHSRLALIFLRIIEWTRLATAGLGHAFNVGVGRR